MAKYIPDEDRDEIFKKLKLERANQFCAECGTPHPQWASATLGIFICYQCSGLHRSFGVHLSFVRSLNMDSWTPKQIYIMQHGGNQRFLEYSKSKGIPQGNPSSMKYSGRAFDEYRKMLSAEADAYLGTSSGSSQQRSGGAAKKVPAVQQMPQKQARPTAEKKEDPLDGWDGWGDMEASLAAIERKQRATPTTAPRQREGTQRSVSQPRSTTPPSSAQRSLSPQPSSSQQQRKPPTSVTPTPKSSDSLDSMDGWSGWGDTESSLAEIERKQQQKQQQNQRNIAAYGGGAKPAKKYESLSSDDYFAAQGGGSSSSYQQPQQQKTFQAYGQSSGPQSYQQGGAPVITDALSSGWSKISSFAKAVAQSTTKAVHDSGLYDAVQGFMNGAGANSQQKSSLLNDQGESSTPRQQYSSSSFQSHENEPASYSKPAPVTTSAPEPKPQPRFVGPTAASQGLKPATGADDEFNELVHGGMSNSRGAKASKPGSDGPLCDDLPDVDAWLDSTLAMEAAKQANSVKQASSEAPSQQTTESTAAETAKTEPSESKEGDSSELGDDWDTW